MKHSANIEELLQLQVDYIGFIFYKPSPRYVGESLTDVLEGWGGVNKVGVFVDEPISEVFMKIQQYDLDAVQLHGKETPEICQQLKEKNVCVIKSFSLSNENDLTSVGKYTEVCDYFLFDTTTPQYGGSGRKFDWKILQHYHSNIPFFLSGGISPNDIETIRSFQHPSLYAIDLNSRFEISPGFKDINKLKNFIQLIYSK